MGSCLSNKSMKAFFEAILPEEIGWKPFPAFPPSARLAVLVGEPLQPGPYTIRVKVPHGVKLMPHKHPEDRVYTVISGVFYIGLGKTAGRSGAAGREPSAQFDTESSDRVPEASHSVGYPELSDR